MKIIKYENSSCYSKNTSVEKWLKPNKYIFACLATSVLFSASAANPAYSYDIVPIGLTNSLDTPYITTEFNRFYDMNNASQVAGLTSRRYQINDTGYSISGFNTWLYNGNTTETIGLSGSEYTRSDNYQNSRFTSNLNDAGQITGISEYFAGPPGVSMSVPWLYNGTETVRVGLTGDAYTRSDGYQDSRATFLNQSGQVAGESASYTTSAYDGSTTLGQSAWLYDGTSTIEIGYYNSDRNLSNHVSGLNNSGMAIGYTHPPTVIGTNGLPETGTTAWIYNGISTVAIGLNTGVHVQSGISQSYSSLINESGQVAGRSVRYDATPVDLTSYSAWFYNGSETVQIGLYDTEHTRDDGRMYNNAELMNENGQVAGTTTRYNGSDTYMGSSAWYFNGTSTAKIGLTDARHTRDDGYQSVTTKYLNEAGQAAGMSERYADAGTEYFGQSVWFSDGNSSFEIGLSGGVYTYESGYQSNNFVDMNEAGQVAGYAYRSTGTTYSNQAGWLYDHNLNQTFELVFSESSTGEANTYIEYLGEDGLVLGQYQLFNDAGSILGLQAFTYTIDGGFFDLGSMLDTTLDEAGWSSLANAIRGNGVGAIVGEGILLDGTGSLFLMTPTVTTVPVPAAVWLFGTGLIALVSFAKRKKP